jgi:hypothetical protein
MPLCGRALPLALLMSASGCAGVIDSCLSVPAPGLEDAQRDLTDALPVLPGAEGFGVDTRAGRGGEIVIVTSLEAEGPGTLREALQGGNRTILFEVGGTIRITEDLAIRSPHVTVAGESAPAPGITVLGAGLFIETHDVLISHLRVRAGDFEDGPSPDVRDAVTIARSPELGDDADVGNIVIDHCSLTWGVDETASVTWPLVHDVTFRHNIIAEGLADSLHSEGEHSKGLIIGDGARRVAVIGNLFAHNNDRSPVMKGDTSSLIVNNVVYNPGDFGIVHYGLPGCCPALASVIANQVIRGPDTPADRGFTLHVTTESFEDSRFFIEDNCGGDPEIADHVQQVDSPDVTVAPLTIEPCEALQELVLSTVGARPRTRDATDARIVDSVRARTGGIIDTPPPEEVQGLLDQAPVTRPLALPASAAEDDDGDGYTNLEAWLHELREAL